MTAIDPPARIAILGAGPIGLEAALYARFLGYSVQVYEQARVACHVLDWGHLTLDRPFGLHCSRLGLAALIAQDADFHAPPDSDALTAANWVADYVRPLAGTDLLQGAVQTETRVLAVARAERQAAGRAAEEADDGPRSAAGEQAGEPEAPWEFAITVRQHGQERRERADAVLDATGVQAAPRGCGPQGTRAAGEQSLGQRIHYGWPDFDRRDAGRFAGRQTLVVGQGCSALTNLLGLVRLAERERGTRVAWLCPEDALRSGRGEAAGSEPARHRERLQERLRRRLRRDPAAVERLRAPGVAALEIEGDVLRVQFAGGDLPPRRFDRLIVNTGFRRNGPRREGLGGQAADAGDRAEEAPVSPKEFRSRGPAAPVPGYFELGAKACGGHPDYRFSDGLDQIRRVFALLTGRDDLDLYKTICV